MNPFAYVRADAPASALTAITEFPGARYVAGGTNLLDLMKLDVEAPPLLVDISRLSLHAIEDRSGALYVGALARLTDVAADARVRQRFPLVAIALEESASPQLRNMATVGGNLLQRTRCAYFRDIAMPCNKRNPGSGCGALDGENRRHAVLGTSPHCIAVAPSDLAVALAAIDATVHVAGRDGPRTIAMRDFYRLPGEMPQIETSLEPNELIAGVSLPPLAFSSRSTYVKVRDRAQYDFALASAAVALDLEDTTIREARIALGGLATVPWRSPEAERLLGGAIASRASFERAAAAAMSGALGRGANDYKISLGQRTLVRALENAAKG
ncbi:MAG TPA: xanthine dehydrogenase family protein subunit M [Candidatus Cybelea sp.]|nr:xanthine dehydrogenase family protein subunit M [Candidatus Cybelea sp.]